MTRKVLKKNRVYLDAVTPEGNHKTPDMNELLQAKPCERDCLMKVGNKAADQSRNKIVDSTTTVC